MSVLAVIALSWLLLLMFLALIVQILDFMFNLHDWWTQRKLRRKIDAIDRECEVREETSKEAD